MEDRERVTTDKSNQGTGESVPLGRSIQRGRGGIYFHFVVGKKGKSTANCSYITRPPATKGEIDSLYLHNFPGWLSGDSYREYRENIIEYVRQKEEEEAKRLARDKRQKRTHYCAVMSFERRIETELARSMAMDYVQSTFPNARVVSAIHHDTDHLHIHMHIQARGIDGKKLNLKKDTYKKLDLKWGAKYPCIRKKV